MLLNENSRSQIKNNRVTGIMMIKIKQYRSIIIAALICLGGCSTTTLPSTPQQQTVEHCSAPEKNTDNDNCKDNELISDPDTLD